ATVSGQGLVESSGAQHFQATSNGRAMLASPINHQPIVWCGVLTDCGTVSSMDVAIEPHGRVYGVSRER
ncbi:hypothetical protein, partial [Xanthomonas vasicola]|uniref:hypothetical protein n=1 Tax=Xanthomonas vasicola TaxID=56459 RepID=UPI001C127766